MNIRPLIHMQPREWHLPKVTLPLSHSHTLRCNHVSPGKLTQTSKYKSMAKSHAYTHFFPHMLVCSFLISPDCPPSHTRKKKHAIQIQREHSASLGDSKIDVLMIELLMIHQNPLPPLQILQIKTNTSKG